MLTALIYFGASSLFLVLATALYLLEDARGKRILFPRARTLLDRVCVAVIRFIMKSVRAVWRGVTQFVLRHGVYRFLAATVAFLRRLERKVEYAVSYNRHAASRPREKRERTHLDEIAEHKESTALSEEERRRRKED